MAPVSLCSARHSVKRPSDKFVRNVLIDPFEGLSDEIFSRARLNVGISNNFDKAALDYIYGTCV